ncbi:MAG: PaaI family thioesterase [Leptospiraceae bacterium]|nr:PaaI family thioesterase [Leptospiraceae bacterium]MCP5511432.1 PaaI family thioesterase [Leptospiraceae bacterium]
MSDSLFKPVPNDKESTCFACGAANPLGLQLVFTTDETIVRTEYTIRKEFAGWSNLTHGGILATILDETMAWTSIYLKQKYILTKNMEIQFLKPVRAGETVTARGWIEEEISHREVRISAEILNSEGAVCVMGGGNMVLFNPVGFRKLNLVSRDFLERFEKIVFRPIDT